jgi:hypothetical protein
MWRGLVERNVEEATLAGLKLGYKRNAASACSRQTGRFAARPVAGAGGIIRCLF